MRGRDFYECSVNVFISISKIFWHDSSIPALSVIVASSELDGLTLRIREPVKPQTLKNLQEVKSDSKVSFLTCLPTFDMFWSTFRISRNPICDLIVTNFKIFGVWGLLAGLPSHKTYDSHVQEIDGIMTWNPGHFFQFPRNSSEPDGLTTEIYFQKSWWSYDRRSWR